MASLKDLRDRIKSVQNTRKITSAMKMVAAAKLRRAQDQAEAGRPYAERMSTMLSSLAAGGNTNLQLLAGTGKHETHMIVLGTADRGLCGGFNSNLIRQAIQLVTDHQSKGRSVKIYCLGRKGAVAMRRQFGDLVVKVMEDLDKPQLSFDKAAAVSRDLLTMFEDGEFDAATLIYAEFQSAISQIVTPQQIIPFATLEESDPLDEAQAHGSLNSSVEYEPGEEEVLSDLLPRNVAVQIYRGLLENAASEQGARMTAMDNATRNAGDMIKSLSLVYNRTRQAQITKELIEIVSGAEAL